MTVQTTLEPCTCGAGYALAVNCPNCAANLRLRAAGQPHGYADAPAPVTVTRVACAVCRRPLHEFPHASFRLEGQTDGDAYHGEVRGLADGFADVYVFGWNLFHVRASRLALSDGEGTL
jgi:hypothetical protein